MSVGRQARPAGWQHHPFGTVIEPLDFSMDLPFAGGASAARLDLVFTGDGLYVPCISRQPAGAGPFPTVIVLHGGSGGLGIGYLSDMVQNQGWALEALLARGYAVVAAEGRMEHEDAYGSGVPFGLDHSDVIEVLGFIARQRWCDAERIGFLGVSHGGELQMKIVHEIASRGGGPVPAALAMCEPAVIEFLGLKFEGVRKEANLQFHARIADAQINIDVARARIAALPGDLPMLVVGRDEDHLQGLFKKLHELLSDAGKRVEWASFSHPEHAYQLGPRRLGDVGYRPDAAQVATLERVLAFLDRHVRDQP